MLMHPDKENTYSYENYARATLNSYFIFMTNASFQMTNTRFNYLNHSLNNGNVGV